MSETRFITVLYILKLTQNYQKPLEFLKTFVKEGFLKFLKKFNFDIRFLGI